MGARHGADTIIAFVNRIDDEVVARRGIQEVTRIMVRDGQVDAALSWLEGLPVPLRRDGLLQLVDGAAVSNPDRWMSYAQTIADKNLGNALISTIASRLAEHDPVRASTLIQNLRPEQYGVAVNNLVSKWYYVDTNGLYAWLAALPRGDFKDAALEQLAGKVRESDKQAALEVAGQISNPQLRQGMLSRLQR